MRVGHDSTVSKIFGRIHTKKFIMIVLYFFSSIIQYFIILILLSIQIYKFRKAG